MSLAYSCWPAGAYCVRRNHRITEHVVIGTHGTLKNLVSKRILQFRHIRILVFDEADEMLKVVCTCAIMPPWPVHMLTQSWLNLLP